MASAIDEMLEELRRNVLVSRVVRGKLERHGEHVLAEERHPRRAIGLLQLPAGGAARAVEHADVVQTEKAALEDVRCRRRPCGSPTSEVEEEL